MTRMHVFLCALFFGLATASAHAGDDTPLAFGAINQRSVPLMAQSWNPILVHVSKKTGIPLVFKIGKTAPETTAMTERGEHAFVYSNHMFTPARDKVGYKAILRIKGGPINGAIVVRDDSPIHVIEDLRGAQIAFPSKDAFVAYWLPMDHLFKTGVEVKEVFAGNQEGAMSQLQFGRVAAAAVNKKILDKYAQREDFRYRLIWTSEAYLDIPIMVHPSVSPAQIEAVRAAFIGMSTDPDGQKALQASAAALESNNAWTFVSVEDKEYDNYRQFYRRTNLKSD